MTELSLARILGFGTRIGDSVGEGGKRAEPPSETCTFVKEVDGWKHVIPGSKVSAGVVETETMNKLQALIDQIQIQIQELSKGKSS